MVAYSVQTDKPSRTCSPCMTITPRPMRWIVVDLPPEVLAVGVGHTVSSASAFTHPGARGCRRRRRVGDNRAYLVTTASVPNKPTMRRFSRLLPPWVRWTEG